jgi:hypothetical protein
MGHVGAAQALGTGITPGRCVDLLQVSLASRAASHRDADGDFGHGGMKSHGHGKSLNLADRNPSVVDVI